MDPNKKVDAPEMEPEKPALSSQEICQKYSSGWGLWQARTFFIASLVKIPTAWQMACITFTALAPEDFWCAPPVGLNVSLEVWRNSSHQKVFDYRQGKEVYSPCYIYDANYSFVYRENVTSLTRCLKFGYDSVQTIITKWDLVCEREILSAVSQFFYLFGILVGGLIATFSIPKFGPRFVILTGMVSQVITGVGIAYSPYLDLKIFLRFLVGCSCSTMISAGYVICTDIVNSVTAKNVISCCYEHFWSAGVITLAIIAYFLPNWTDLQLALSIPTILILLMWRWIPNSTKWLMEKKRFDEARRQLATAAKLNGLEEPPAHLENCLSPMKTCTLLEYYKENSTLKVFCVHMVWICTIVTYYGALLNVKNLGDHVVMNTIIAGLAEVIGVLLGLALILHSTKKWIALAVIQIIGGSACFICWVIPAEFDPWQTETTMMFLAMLGRVAVAVALTLLQVASHEFWPARYRQKAFFSCLTIARIFLLSAPFIGTLVFYGAGVSLSVFGALTTIAGIFTFMIKNP